MSLVNSLQNVRNIKNWISFGSSRSLICCGGIALACKGADVIIFTDLETRNLKFFPCNSIETGAGVSIIAGHDSLCIFAFIESVIMPKIHVYSYPLFNHIVEFDSCGQTRYEDLCFSKSDLLIAFSSFPSYTLRVFNFRNAQLLYELDTYRHSGFGSLYCSHAYLPTIVQFSQQKRKIFVYDLCHTAEGYNLLDVSQIPLGVDQNYSDMFSMCFAEDNSIYAVNDFGDLLSVEIGLFYLKPQWLMKRQGDIVKPQSHMIQYGKRGIFISNVHSIHFLKRKGNEWQEEFNISTPDVEVRKIVSDLAGDLYVADVNSNTYKVDLIEGQGILSTINNDCFKTINYTLINGVREEVLVVWTNKNELIALDCRTPKIYSTYSIKDISFLNSHSVQPIVVLANKLGEVHILSYQKPQRPPVLISIIQLDTHVYSLKAFESTILALDVFHTCYVIKANYKLPHFYVSARFKERHSDKKPKDFYALTQNSIIILYSNNVDTYWPTSNEMILFQWTDEDSRLIERTYSFPYEYVDFAMSPYVNDENIFELFCVRKLDIIVDVYEIIPSGKVTLIQSIKTQHNTPLSLVSFARNLVTTSISAIYLTYRVHNKSKKSFVVTQLLQQNFRPQIPKQVSEIFNAKYLIVLHEDLRLQIMRLNQRASDLEENTVIAISEDVGELEIKKEQQCPLQIYSDDYKMEPTEAEISKRSELLQRIQQLSVEVRELIDYDISVAGEKPGMYRKYCLNEPWLDQLMKQAKLLYNAERESLMAAIEDQERIRNWIINLLTVNTAKISSKLRSLFSNLQCENFSLKKSLDFFEREYNHFYFFDMEPPDDDLEEIFRESQFDPENVNEEEIIKSHSKPRNLYIVHGSSVYDHIMSKEFQMQSVDEVSFYQLHNSCAKFAVNLNDPLKKEFNKYFDEAMEYKQQIMDNILNTNLVLHKIYENMNIMRHLLYMEPFVPPELIVPIWAKDEILESIMTVDESEIKAINRRKKQPELVVKKSGRMLLWALEFWERSLMTMMDGVLEKLWEEEIKKDIPVPEFVLKKNPHEYSLEEQRLYRDYEEKVHQLKLDREKYLRILSDNELKSLKLKSSYINKFNEKITQLYILKLNYDFAMKQCRLRLINLKTIQFKRVQYHFVIDMIREDLEKISDYVLKYVKVCEFWEKSMTDIKNRLEAAGNRERTVERNFRSHFLNAIPANFVPEMRRLYKKHPKLHKSNMSVMICDLTRKMLTKSRNQNFPLQPFVTEFLKTLEELDDVHSMPNQMDPKYWDQFVRLRRQKIENELTTKSITLKLLEVQNGLNKHLKTMSLLKSTRTYAQQHMDKSKKEYLEVLQNRALVLTLTRGQVEVSITASTAGFKNSILMHVDDINDINEKIRQTGLMKLRAMQRVATFRRQVIYKEWEHEVTKANINYLKYMLEVIEKCKVSREFLMVLRNWEREHEDGKNFKTYLGSIEKVMEDRIFAERVMLERYVEKMDQVRESIAKTKQKNIEVNKKIENLKINLALKSVYRDHMNEEKRSREQHERMVKIKAHRRLMEKVREDYAHILELKTILELQRLRTYPTLGPAPDCPGAEGEICIK